MTIKPPPALLTPVGLSRDDKHVYGFNDGTTVTWPLVSVTTVIGVIDKSGPLVGWAKREVANAAVRNLTVLSTMVDASGQESAAKWLGTIPGYQRDTAADIGTRIHALAESISRGNEVVLTEAEQPFIDHYRQFLADWSPTFLAAEEMVCNLTLGYAGTLDAIVEMGGETWLLDYKTSKGTYPETALQLAAYANAEFIGRPLTPRKFRIPPVTRYGVLHLRPESYELVPYAVDDTTFAAFRDALSLHRWRDGQSREVVGKPLRRTA